MKLHFTNSLIQQATIEIQIEEYEAQLKQHEAALRHSCPEAAESLQRLEKTRRINTLAEKEVLEPLRKLGDIDAIQIACEALSLLADLKNLLSQRRHFA
jgi:hypothetical protein